MVKRRYLESAILGLILLSIIVLAAYPHLRGSKGSSTSTVAAEMDKKRYSTDLNKLRDQFNQDKGKVRLLLLLSPT